jgi:N-methylhydantoinase B
MGDPTDRDAAVVARDVRDGLVSAEVATRVYKVALTADGAVDDAGTTRLRKAHA